MKLTKTYTLTNKNFMCLSVEVEGRKIWIEFRSLRSHNKGSYTTDDPNVIKALEECNEFGVEYVISKTQGEEPKPIIITPKAEVVEDDGPAIEPYNDIIPDKEGISVEGISSVAKARQYLLENIEDIKTSELSNKEKVLDVASKNNISFPDLI